MYELLIVIAVILLAFIFYWATGFAILGGNPESADKRYAYCTLVMKGDNYIPGAIALAESLHEHCPDVDSIVMVTDDVSEEGRTALGKVFTHVKLIPYINSNSRTASKRQEELYSAWMSSSFTKWNLLDFTEYDKILFMDADTIAVENLRPIFDLSAPAICMGSPWMKPWADKGLDNPMGEKKHGDKVPSAQIWKQLKGRSSGMMGGVVLLKPEAGATDKLRAMLARYPVFPPLEYKCMASADEQAIAQLMVEMGKTWSAIGNRLSYMVGKTNMLRGEKPGIMHYYHNKPWDYPRTHWEEYLTWYKYVDSAVARFPELKKWFKHV